jgi:hypothetical protein
MRSALKEFQIEQEKGNNPDVKKLEKALKNFIIAAGVPRKSFISIFTAQQGDTKSVKTFLDLLSEETKKKYTLTPDADTGTQPQSIALLT